MTKLIPEDIAFSHFAMGMDYINSRTEFRMSREIIENLKNSPVYSFLVDNPHFKAALVSFRSLSYIQNHRVKDDVLYADYIALSLINIMASCASTYLNKYFLPEDSLVVSTQNERKRIADKLEEVMEYFHHRPVNLSEADYLQFERTAYLMMNALSKDELLAYPQRSSGTRLIREKRFVLGLYKKFYETYHDTQPTLIITLSQIILGELISEETMLDWLKSKKKACEAREAIDLNARSSNKRNDKYLRT